MLSSEGLYRKVSWEFSRLEHLLWAPAEEQEPHTDPKSNMMEKSLGFLFNHESRNSGNWSFSLHCNIQRRKSTSAWSLWCTEAVLLLLLFSCRKHQIQRGLGKSPDIYINIFKNSLKSRLCWKSLQFYHIYLHNALTYNYMLLYLTFEWYCLWIQQV